MDKSAVISNLLSGSLALAGLLLVFCGFLFSQAASFPGTTDDEVINKFRNAGKIAVLPFVAALAIAFLCLLWTLDQSETVYLVCVIGSFVLIGGTAIYGAYSILRYL